MFDLEKSVTDWRKQMLDAGIQSPVPLEELELHLREEIEEQMKSGRSEAEAFELAAWEIGQAGAMQGEFKKIDGVMSPTEWRVMEIAFAAGASVFPLLAIMDLLRFKGGALADVNSGQQMSGVLAVLLFTALAWGGRLGCRMLPATRNKRVRGTILAFVLVPVIIWWVAFMNVIVPRHDYSMCEFPVAFLWAFVVPGGLVMGLGWGMEAAARRVFPAAKHHDPEIFKQ